MDKAYCGAATRRLGEECELEPIVPPKSNAKKPWRYDVVCPVSWAQSFTRDGTRSSVFSAGSKGFVVLLRATIS